jgi:hypothetical protein
LFHRIEIEMTKLAWRGVSWRIENAEQLNDQSSAGFANRCATCEAL